MEVLAQDISYKRIYVFATPIRVILDPFTILQWRLAQQQVYWGGLFVILSLRMQSAMFFRRLRATDSPCRTADKASATTANMRPNTTAPNTRSKNLHVDSVAATWTPSQQRYAMELNTQLLSFGIEIRTAFSRCPPSQPFGKPVGGPCYPICIAERAGCSNVCACCCCCERVLTRSLCCRARAVLVFARVRTGHLGEPSVSACMCLNVESPSLKRCNSLNYG